MDGMAVVYWWGGSSFWLLSYLTQIQQPSQSTLVLMGYFILIFIDHDGRGNNVSVWKQNNSTHLETLFTGGATILELYLKITTKQLFQLSIRSHVYLRDFHRATDIYRNKIKNKTSYDERKERRDKEKWTACAAGHRTAAAEQKPLQPSSVLWIINQTEQHIWKHIHKVTPHRH